MAKITVDKDKLLAVGAFVVPIVGGILSALKSKSDIDKSVSKYLAEKQNQQ